MIGERYWTKYYKKHFGWKVFSAGTKMWDEFADRYDGFSRLSRSYTEIQVNALKLEKGDTLLDVGCGTGRLSIPLAGKVNRVTAIDASEPMLAHARENAEAEKVGNIEFIRLPWEDAVPGKNLPVHDVVIASRSPAFGDIKKIDALCGKRAYLLTYVGPSLKSFHDDLMEGILEKKPAVSPKRPPVYRIFFNLLCEMGYHPSVFFVDDGFTKIYAGRDEVYADFSWLGVPEDKQGRFRENLERYLFKTEDGKIRLLRETKTVIVSWDKELLF